MIDVEKIKSILLTGLQSLADKNHVGLNNIQVSFGLSKNKLNCLIYLNGQPKTADLTDIIGSHLYNFLVKSRLESKISVLAKANNDPDGSDTSLRVMANPDLKVFLFKSGQQLREVTANELI